jgi:hypothetical protein
MKTRQQFRLCTNKRVDVHVMEILSAARIVPQYDNHVGLTVTRHIGELHLFERQASERYAVSGIALPPPVH